jgi:hypothetical protein
MMKVLPRAQCGRAQWDAVVSVSSEAWVWALWDWQEVILAVPRWQLEDASFAIADGDRIVGVVPLQWSGDRARVSGSGFGLTAPALSSALRPAERDTVTAFAFAHVRALALSGSAQRIDFALSPVSEGSIATPLPMNPFLAHGYSDNSGVVRVVDLQQEEQQILAGFSRDTRQQIRRAREAGVSVRQVDWREFLDEYYAVHVETYERTGEVPHPREYFAGIASRLAPAGHSVLWAATTREGRIVAFHNSARLGRGAMYHTGCSRAAALHNGANYLAFWEALVGAKAAGCLAYEIGEIFPGALGGKKEGLSRFKSKFGGDTRPLYRGSLELPALQPPAAATGRDP